MYGNTDQIFKSTSGVLNVYKVKETSQMKDEVRGVTKKKETPAIFGISMIKKYKVFLKGLPQTNLVHEKEPKKSSNRIN